MMDMFSLEGKNALVIGGAGVLASSMAIGLAKNGANVVIAARSKERAKAVVDKIIALGRKSAYMQADATNKEELLQLAEAFSSGFGKLDILINAVGGNKKEATCSKERGFFDLSSDAIEEVIHLNLMAGAILPCQVFGKLMCETGGGSIINISSMNAYRPLTNTPGYAAAKGAVSNFTQWLAVELARRYGESIRVNAIAPGFFVTDQNRFLLTDVITGELTARGRSIVDHTPMGRFGEPEDLIGATVWLASRASAFVTGVVIPVDGGFTSYTGV